MSTPNTTPTAADARSSASYDPVEIRLNSGETGRIWEMQSGRFGWCHPNGSQGQSASFRAAEDELNAADGPADTARPTPGPWTASQHTDIPDNQRLTGGHRIWMAGGAAALVYGMGATRDEVAANARLIAEAGTVLHESGRTPRQLLEERDALAAALKSLLGWADFVIAADSAEQPFSKSIAENARAALAMAKGGKQ